MSRRTFARRSLPSLAAALMLLTIPVHHLHAQNNDQLHTASPQELGVVKTLLTQQNAWNAGNLNGFLAGYKDSPEVLFIGASVLHGFNEISTDYHRNFPGKDAMGTLTYSDFDVRPMGENFASCIGKYHIDRSRKAGGPSEGIFSVVLEKTAEGWKIVLDHTT